MKYLLALVALALGGCQALTDIAAALPTPTPQEQCEDGGGRWRPITTYDANGNAQFGGECVGHPEWNQAPVIVRPAPEHGPAVIEVTRPTPHVQPAQKKPPAKKAAPQKDEKDKPA